MAKQKQAASQKSDTADPNATRRLKFLCISKDEAYNAAGAKVGYVYKFVAAMDNSQESVDMFAPAHMGSGSMEMSLLYDKMFIVDKYYFMDISLSEPIEPSAPLDPAVSG
jgi:hypothetical protein